MGFFSQNEEWTLLPPSNVIRAQLVRRDPSPERVMDDVTVTYAIEPDQADDTLTGTLEANDDAGRFEARVAIPPYAKDGEYNPLPIVTLTAKDSSGKILATAKLAAPTSDQMGCYNCHSGTWHQGGPGVTKGTVENILITHDRMNSTKLARTEGVVECTDCHDDPIQGVEENDDKPNLSAAIHGVHAIYMAGRGAEDSCLKCHPQSTLRGQHEAVGFTCTDCHGMVEDLAVSLLKSEIERGVPGAGRLMARITPRTVANKEAIKPRKPWVNEPDCLTCHVDFGPPETDSAFNTWTEDADGLFAARRDDMDAMHCGACHGSPHAIYPATPRDNVMPLQYMDEAQPWARAATARSATGNHGIPRPPSGHGARIDATTAGRRRCNGPSSEYSRDAPSPKARASNCGGSSATGRPNCSTRSSCSTTSARTTRRTSWPGSPGIRTGASRPSPT